MKVLKEGECVEMVSGDWISLPSCEMYQRCCDCGLIHYWQFRATETGGMMVFAESLTKEEYEVVKKRWDTSERR